MIAAPLTCVRERAVAANFGNFQLEQPSGSGASVEEPATAGRPASQLDRTDVTRFTRVTACHLVEKSSRE